MTTDDIVAFLKTVATQLEGEYKWYVIGGVALLLTAGITRFIFKTYKWFFLALIIGAIVLAGIWSLANSVGLTGLFQSASARIF